MQDFAAVLGNAVTGLFTLLGAFLAWRLRRKDDEGERIAAVAIAKRKELVELFAQVFMSLEQAMKCAIEQEPFDLTTERSLVNAKLGLLASEQVNLAYDDVSDKLRSWAALHIAASPRRTTIGDQAFVVLQAPDPREKYKVPAEEARKLMHEALQVLRERMRADLGDA